MYEIYCKLRDSKGMKDSDVAKATGITKSTPYNVFCVVSVDLLTFFQKRSLQIHIIGRIIKPQTTRNNIKRLKSQQQTTYKHGGNII